MLIKPSLSSRGSKHYHQGRFIPRNPQKYIGNVNNIIYRSKWELIFLKWCDTNDSILKYSSEECIIPYISPIDGKQHRYFMDFFISTLQSDGSIKNFLVEIKPYAQTKPPKATKKNNKESDIYKQAVNTYLINQAKWMTAEKVCQKRGWGFKVITEKELFRGK